MKQLTKSKFQMTNDKLKLQIQNFAFCLAILPFVFCIFNLSTVRALNMSSDSYQIQMGNLNMSSGSPSSTNYKMTQTMGQTAPGKYTDTGYQVLAGFQYIHSLIPFTFTISDTSIDFGILTSNSFNDQTNTLTVSCGSAGGYQVTVLANKQLTSRSGTTIPKTTCGSTACTLTQAQPWTSTSYYGFGYNVSGDDKPSDFVDTTYFRPFPDQESGDSAQAVMKGTNVGRNKQVTVTYRINISGTQPAGDYENNLVFVATPTY